MNPHRMSRWARLVAIAALVPTLAWAQEGPGGERNTVDPDDPVDRTAGLELHAWDVMNVSGLPAHSTLGTIWVGTKNDAYVWALRPVVEAGTEDGIAIPEDPPLPPIGAPPRAVTMISTLLHFDGSAWTPVLERTGETGATLFGTDADNVYATTDLPDGTVRVYHFDGLAWRLEHLPAGITGPAGDLAGQRGRTFFRTGNAVLVSSVMGWKPFYRNDQIVSGHALVFAEGGQLFVPAPAGHAFWNGTNWDWVKNPVPMDTHGAWGGRDLAGELHLFVAGSDVEHCGPTIWQYVERIPNTLDGSYCVIVSPPAGEDPNSGTGVEMWGAAVHDVYAVTAMHGSSHLLRFNGQAWTEISAMRDMPSATSVWGTREGDVWVALADGRVLRGVRRVPLVADIEDEPPPVDVPARIDVSVQREAVGVFSVAYRLPAAKDVAVRVYDVAGRQVATLQREHRAAGPQQVRWDARGVPPGVYFCQVRAGSLHGGRRIVIDR